MIINCKNAINVFIKSLDNMAKMQLYVLITVFCAFRKVICIYRYSSDDSSDFEKGAIARS